MKEVFLGVLFCLMGIAFAIFGGAMIWEAVLDSDLHSSGLANQAGIIFRVMSWVVLMVLDVFLVMVPSLRLIRDR